MLAKTENAARLVELKHRPIARKAPAVRSHLWPRVLAALAVVFVVALFLFVRYFAYSESRVTEALRDEFPGSLGVDHFETVYFPHPGCRVEGITFRSKSSSPASPPLVTIQTLTIQGSYVDFLLRPHHISRVLLAGVRIQIPQLGQSGDFNVGNSRSQTTIGEVVADAAVLEFTRAGNGPPLRFDLHELSLGPVGTKDAMSYRVIMQSPEPPGEITSKGQIGPINAGDPGQTAVRGTYSFDRADLSTFHGIAGTLASKGTFSGLLAHLDVQGTANVPDFEVVRSGHAEPLSTHFQAAVDAMTGDVALNSIDAVYMGTKIRSKGTVAGKKGSSGKFTSLDFAVQNGRIQDILRIFVKADRPPLSGVTDFRAHVTVPPQGGPFLKRVAMAADFGIGEGQFQKSTTQQKVDQLSETARGEKKDKQVADESNPSENVISDLGGHVELRGGVATFTTLSFTIPGADARLHGTFNVLDGSIDLHGTVKMAAKVSQSTSGVESAFAMVLNPFFDKKHGSVVPVLIDGTYHTPHFGIDLNPIKK
jgi:hypothetical protein